MPINIQDRSEYLSSRQPRRQPYRRVRHDDRGQYYDFKLQPHLIETSLEDFTPHALNDGVQRFYDLLRHINRPDGPFETTDCGLSQRLHVSSNSPFPEKAGWIGGRVMLMWRDMAKNCRGQPVAWLKDQLLRQFKRYRQRHNYIGFVLGPFPTVFEVTGERGYQIDIEFAMWGDTYEEALERFPEVVTVLDRAIRRIEKLHSEKRKAQRHRSREKR